jgi:hypothetical protein
MITQFGPDSLDRVTGVIGKLNRAAMGVKAVLTTTMLETIRCDLPHF